MKALFGMLAGVSTSIAFAGAYAQTAVPADSPSPVAAEPATSAENALGDIVVTAQRRSENLQRVPIAITAVSGEQLSRQGITQPLQLVAIAPGLSIGQSNGPTTQIYLRGVGTSSANAYADNAVAFNVDGVYIARSTGLSGFMYDLARVEVLKGPQGTLYGRNATGGAINIVANKPSFDRIGGDLELEAGNYNLLRASGDLNLPVTSNFALRVAGQINHRDGYFTDGYDDDRSGSARLKALWEPTSNLSILLSTDYAHNGGKGGGSVLAPYVDGGNPWKGSSTAAAQAEFSSEASPLPLAAPKDDGFQNIDNYGVSAEINWKTDLGTLTILPAYRHLEAKYRNYVPGFQNDISETATQRSVEARFATDDSLPVSLIVGGFAFHENRKQDNVVDQTITGSETIIHGLPTTSYAGFGQLRWNVTDRLRLTGGARYTHEHKSLDGESISTSDVVTPLTGDQSFSKVTWKAGVEYDAGRNSLVYANVSTGFKAGGFYSDSAPNNTYKPETLTSYVIGTKNTLFDGRVRLNAEAFWWDYKNHQESHLAYGNAGIVYKTENVGKETIKGLEGDMMVKVGRLGQLTARVQYLDTKLDSFSYTSVVPVGSPNTTCNVTALGGVSYRIDCSGKRAIRSPKFSGTVGYQQGYALPGGAMLTGNVDVEMATSSYLAIDYTDAEKQKAYALVDLSLSYTPPSKRYTVTGWIRNVANTAVLNAAIQQLFATSITMVDLRAPRTFGGRVAFHF